MKLRLLAAGLLLLAYSGSAQAAKCYISEFSNIGIATGQIAQIASEPAITDQVTGDFSGGAVQSNAFNAQTNFIRLWCDTQGSFLVGTNPTATANNAPIAAGVPEYFAVPLNQGFKLSVHANP